ncbi:MAG: MBOAT family protein [Azonexus sp.]|nr:MBOAT family protein [Betaproteobacteria bacterium]MBK8918964.1 MBOAT family protein [Betaproteobacteria bacterium]MBP6035778.1 MBOAT family protein [Azonexus sp.]MBP6905415.1 MBOAT family protein [Azonexus sp.]
MLFNSYEFLLVYLPLTLAGYFALGRRSATAAATWLAIASLAFYGWWDVRYLPLLGASIAFNYLMGGAIARRAGTPAANRLLALAVGGDLLALAWYKYAGFFASSANALLAAGLPVPEIVLPLGISFFTFTQIAYLVDAWAGKVRETRPVHYVLFVSYFPHLIAGPVLHHGEMMPQFDRLRNYRPRLNNFIIGGSIFIFGLFKKVVIADNLAPNVGTVFDQTSNPTLLVAWGGVLAYTFQLYFDFSGYSDMAIGLSRLFGVRLPLNFNSPYKATSITDFWRRWHMTLSRFLRDYLYVPLGGNRKGKARRYVNLLLTMLLGGLWHGAGWTYVLWGALHGIYLCIHHAWSALARGWRLPRPLAVALTFGAVIVGWVFFRATSVAQALDILAGMAGLHGVALPEAIASQLGPLKAPLAEMGVQFYFGKGAQFVSTWVWVALAAAIAFGLPNTQEWHHRFGPALEAVRSDRRAHLSLSSGWALGLGLACALCVVMLSQPSEFLYFQF